jgi:hypothetical protein
VGHKEGPELLTLLVSKKMKEKKEKKKKDKVEAKVGNSLCKLAFAFPFTIYF